MEMIDFFDLLICPEKLKIVAYTSEKIHNLKIPRTLAELWSFISQYDAFRQFFSIFARTTYLLDKLLRTNQMQALDDFCEDKRNALKRLQGWLISPPILAQFHAKGRYTTYIEALDRPVVAIDYKNSRT